jgi:uncharacterized phiE125 gp8 family phage protein
MLKPVRTVAPATDTLLPLDAVKAQLNVLFDDDDPLIRALTEAAIARADACSGTLGRALLTQSWKATFRDFLCQGRWYYDGSPILRLPLGDLIALTSVKYYDTNNAQQTLAVTVYQAFSDESGPFVALKPLQQWPSIYARADAVEVIWQAGYGPTAADVPADLRHGLLMLIAYWYENRETASLSQLTLSEMPFATTALLEKYRVTRF